MRLKSQQRNNKFLTHPGIKVAVLPSPGIGDGLLMMIASHQLKMGGNQVFTFHNHLPELSSWFPGHPLLPLPAEEHIVESLRPYDLIVIQNDNSPKVRHLNEAYPDRLCIFYPTYRIEKHLRLQKLDQIFNHNLPMADNIANAAATLIGHSPSKGNGLTPPLPLIHRQRKTQVLIHPTSSSANKNWTMSKFIEVAKKLRQQGFSPIFCLSGPESSHAAAIEKGGLELAVTPTLSELAALTYTSGFVIGNDSAIGHLASNLHIPTLIIANEEKRMRLWRPGWLQGELVLPSFYLPNWKFLRLKTTHWQHFISVDKVLRSFNSMCHFLGSFDEHTRKVKVQS